MTFNIQIQERAIKSLKKIHEPNKTYIKNALDRLENFSPEMSNVKSLQGEYKGFYRLRVGDYRILFNLTDNTIEILDIFTRQTGY